MSKIEEILSKKIINKRFDIFFNVIVVMLAVFLVTSLYPYKEIVTCNFDNCSVQKLYVLKFINHTYYFHKQDKLIVEHTSHRGAICNYISNESDYNNVIDNCFISKESADTFLNLLKQNGNITKYWIGYKTENKI